MEFREKKFVYNNRGHTKVPRGWCLFNEDFLEIENEKDTNSIEKSNIISIKDGDI